METHMSSAAAVKSLANLSEYSGQGYLDKFTEYLGSELEVDIATIAFLVDGGKRLHTVSLYWDGKHVDNFKYEIEHAPCAESVSQEFCLYQSMLQSHFPEDQFIIDEKLVSYIGFPLVDENGDVFGVMNAANRYEVDPNGEQYTMMKHALAKVCEEAAHYRKTWHS